VAAFPVRSGTYVNIPEVARYMAIDSNASAVAPYFVPGANTISMTIFAQKGWEERPFDLFARFRVGESMLLCLLLPAMMGLAGSIGARSSR
jgi:hypothetical protein